MSDIVDVAIIGTGPCRLSLAAYLRMAGASYCHFDNSMRLRHPAVRGDMPLACEYWSILRDLAIRARAVGSVISGTRAVVS
jgi:flavin-dependent dehydrogenase